MIQEEQASVGPLPQFATREEFIHYLMNRKTKEFPNGYPRKVAEDICQGIERDQAVARREATIPGPGRQEIEQILHTTIRYYARTRQLLRLQPFTVEEKQAMLQQLKHYVYCPATFEENQAMLQRLKRHVDQRLS
jgi:hypothetical protein